jgi:demethylmenaquinone methyltransferase/2-methoxy-6-polyprenyl-1,4-benzoquinol methylase
MGDTVPESTLEEMRAYYRARAAEYDEWCYRRGRFDHGPESNAEWFSEFGDGQKALQTLQVEGDVLELASGTGIWTEQILQSATSITAVDASEEMIAINRAKIASERVQYIQADLFSWQPERTYDAVCFCFWISHVPVERLDAFLCMVAKALRPGGKVFFVDTRRELSSTAIDHVLPEKQEQLMIRKLNDGRAFQIVKNFYDAAFLEERLAAAGLNVTVKVTPTYFIYGYGSSQVV